MNTTLISRATPRAAALALAAIVTLSLLTGIDSLAVTENAAAQLAAARSASLQVATTTTASPV
jgi:hypothetical protein